MNFNQGMGSGKMHGDINVTPMIDVLLVLLIIFMVITPVAPRGLAAALPQRAAHSNSTTAIVVQILNGGDGAIRFRINQEDVRLEDLPARLTTIFSLRADGVMFVKADDALSFSTVAQVMDIGRSAGARHVGLLTSKDPL